MIFPYLHCRRDYSFPVWRSLSNEDWGEQDTAHTLCFNSCTQGTLQLLALQGNTGGLPGQGHMDITSLGFTAISLLLKLCCSLEYYYKKI